MSVLKMTGNKIETLNRKYFQNMARTLKELYIGTNKITTINSTSLPEEMWERLKKIDLSDNRWNCDCGIIWFRGWLRQNKGRVVNITKVNEYVCNSDEALKGTPLLNLTLSIEDCYTTLLDYYLVSTVVIALILYFFVFAAAVLHRYRWHAKYWYFVYKVIHFTLINNNIILM